MLNKNNEQENKLKDNVIQSDSTLERDITMNLANVTDKNKSKEKKRKHKISTFIRRGSTSKDAPILKVENVEKVFGSFQALNGITFHINRGERVGLIGGNGAGKTTLSEIIAGINKPTSGIIEYGFKFDDSPKEGIGMQFQESEYPSGLTVKDIIQFAINLRKLKVSIKEFEDLLNIFQMSDFYTRKVRSLSGGQRQKLNILLSIIHNPKLVILDELSTGLDISAREEIIEFTDKLLTTKKMSAILISHHMSEIKALCSRVIILDNGFVRDIKTIEEIEELHGSLEEYSRLLITESNSKLVEMEKEKNSSKQNKSMNRKLFKKKKNKDKQDPKLKENNEDDGNHNNLISDSETKKLIDDNELKLAPSNEDESLKTNLNISIDIKEETERDQ